SGVPCPRIAGVHMTLTTVLAILGGCAGLLAAARLIRGLWRVNRRIVRIADLVTELSPNSGHSIKDKVDQTAESTLRTEQKVDAVGRRLEDHIRNHPGG